MATRESYCIMTTGVETLGYLPIKHKFLHTLYDIPLVKQC